MNKHFIARVLAILILLMMVYAAGVYLKPVEAGMRDTFYSNNWRYGYNVTIVKDRETGCQYLHFGSGAVTPRLNMGGKLCVDLLNKAFDN